MYEFLFKCLTATYFHLLQLNNKLHSLVEGIAMGTIEELPTVDSAEIMEKDDEPQEEKEEGERGGNNDGNKTTELDTYSGSRNVTTEVLSEHGSDQVKDSSDNKRASRAKYYRAQVMKALNERIVDEEKLDYTFDRKHFKTLMKVSSV